MKEAGGAREAGGDGGVGGAGRALELRVGGAGRALELRVGNSRVCNRKSGGWSWNFKITEYSNATLKSM